MNDTLLLSYSQHIKKQAAQLGFLSCGISKAEFLVSEAPRLEQWLNQGHHGTMSYMERNFDKRLDPTKLVDGAQSVISLMYNYTANKKPMSTAKIASYALGKDYHKIVKDKAYQLLASIQNHISKDIGGRVFVDSAPVLERAWAERSGLGWIGKNSNLISKKIGSFYFLAEIIIDTKLIYDTPTTDHCGQCTRCIDACPTEAIIAPYVVDSNKCISYLTIEYKEAIPNHFSDKMNDWMFGCDVCQEVCPWNRFTTPNKDADLQPSQELLNMTDKDWVGITEEHFNTLFKDSAVKRTKFKGLKRNIDFLKLDDKL